MIQQPNPAMPRFLLAGDRALTVEFGQTIEASTNLRVQQLAARLNAQRGDAIVGVVPTYRSLTVSYEPLRISLDALRAKIVACLADEQLGTVPPRRWRVPVCYGGESREFGEDLETFAATHAMTPDEVIAVHSAPVYRVYMVGFLPGFAYLGDLDARLHTPRRAVPRPLTPAGSINVGGQQTAIASVAGPSGWHLLGLTPWRSFDPLRENPFLFAAGDEVVFQPIGAQDYRQMATAIEHGEYAPQPLSSAPEDGR